MKIDCDIIRDLLPLYSEGMVSTKSTEMIEEHFTECEACQKQYQKMMIPAPVVTFDTAPAKNFKKYVTKKKRRFGWKIALITAAAIISITALYFLIFGGAIGLLMLKWTPMSVIIHSISVSMPEMNILTNGKWTNLSSRNPLRIG